MSVIDPAIFESRLSRLETTLSSSSPISILATIKQLTSTLHEFDSHTVTEFASSYTLLHDLLEDFDGDVKRYKDATEIKNTILCSAFDSVNATAGLFQKFEALKGCVDTPVSIDVGMTGVKLNEYEAKCAALWRRRQDLSEKIAQCVEAYTKSVEACSAQINFYESECEVMLKRIEEATKQPKNS